jgi:hypothetical protein
MVKTEKALAVFKQTAGKYLDSSVHKPVGEITKDNGTVYLVCWCDVTDMGFAWDLNEQELTETLLELDIGTWCAWVLRGCPTGEDEDEEDESSNRRIKGSSKRLGKKNQRQ